MNKSPLHNYFWIKNYGEAVIRAWLALSLTAIAPPQAQVHPGFMSDFYV
jgi:hypothetical protein